MSRTNPNRLLVEGDEDKRVIPQLMECFIPWGNTRETWPVHIESCGSVDELLKPGVIEAELKISGQKALGVLLDADKSAKARWASVRARALKAMPEIPRDLPEEGLVCENTYGQKFGVWIMPDNKSSGMLETFLSLFVRDGSSRSLWNCVERHCKNAKAKHKAPYKAANKDKAHIHAWLALADPPGQQLHLAVLTRTLDPRCPHSAAFVTWFRKLYGL